MATLSHSLPSRTRFVIIGTGIQGLFTAWQPGTRFDTNSSSAREDVIILVKSAIACGVVRKNYFLPAMRELKAHGVDIWEGE